MSILAMRVVRLFGLAGIVLAGCTEATEPTRHYVIDATEPRSAVRQVAAREGPIIAVTPVVLPEYLNQNGIVTRNSRNEITRAQLDVWAGPLSEEIGRAVAENLSAMLPTDRVTLSANRRSIPVDYTVDIEVVQFEREAANNAVDLVARWTVFRGDERSVLVMRRSQFHVAAAGPEYRDTVAAMSQAITALSDEIATAIAQGRDRRRPDRWAAQRTPRAPGGEASGAPARRR